MATAPPSADSAPQLNTDPARGRQLGGIALILAFTIVLATTLSYARGVLNDPTPSGAQQFLYVPDARFARIASLGHTAAAADLLWFHTINYFGKHYRSDQLYPWLAKMCDVVTDLDPKAQHVYRFAGVVLPWEVGLPDDGIRLLHKGVRELPDSWLLHYLLGMNYFFFKDDVKNAAIHLQLATQAPGEHPDFSHLTAALYAEGGNFATAEGFLADMARSAPDESTRQMLTTRLGEARLARGLDTLNAAVNRYREQFGALPTTLVQLVGSGVIAALPLEPFGGHYVVNPTTGRVTTTSGHAPLRLHRSKVFEAYHKRNEANR